MEVSDTSRILKDYSSQIKKGKGGKSNCRHILVTRDHPWTSGIGMGINVVGRSVNPDVMGKKFVGVIGTTHSEGTRKRHRRETFLSEGESVQGVEYNQE